jgi:hypothetical protein
MRALILVAAVALGLSGCGKNAQTESNQAAGETLSADNIVSNDVTAIDAVTGDAANMAADVDLNFGNLAENATGIASNEPARRPPPRKSAPATAAATSNAVANTAATNAE